MMQRSTNLLEPHSAVKAAWGFYHQRPVFEGREINPNIPQHHRSSL
jgi:hypothetical protein